MRLELGRIRVKDAKLGPTTRLEGGVLAVNAAELKEKIAVDERLEGVDVELARPGESARIVRVKDVIEPRVKVQGKGGVFPGFTGPVTTVGEGRTHVLDGVAVVTTGPIVGFQEGIIDMSGPVAEYTPFSKTCNVVLNCHTRPDLKQHQREEAIRLAGLRAAAYLGEVARHVDSGDVTVYDTPEPINHADSGLPRVVYLYMLQSQGLLHDTFVYGVDAKRILPTFMYPTEVMDGAIVSGNCVSACDKNTTYHHQNNPVIEEMYTCHGKDLVFVGVVITNENVTMADKERSSDYAAKLVHALGARGAIVTEEGFGNPDSDLIMNCVKLERLGIKTVLLTDEYAGRDGASPSLADADDLADAVVSTGNANELVWLPPVERVLGDTTRLERLAGAFSGSLRRDGSLVVELQAITGATNELGFSRLGARGQ
ncbi:MAG: glycine/sarcosine/betaine reductase component B subunit [Bacillota bacterium]